MIGVHHPWRDFRALTDWTLRWARLPIEIIGLTDFPARTVTLDRNLSQAERRCTIAHEVEHIRRGPVPAEPVLAAREEAAVDLAVARRLIDLKRLGEVLAWSESIEEAADELWVDVDTLRVRLDHLHPSEVHFLRRRIQCDPSECGSCRHLTVCKKGEPDHVHA